MRHTTSGPVFRRFRTHHLATVTVLLLSSAVVLALAITPAAGQDQNARPGATDPMGKPGRYTLFPSHELLSFEPATPAALNLTTYNFDQNLKVTQTSVDQQPWDPHSTQLVAAAGRISAPDHDQVAFARRSGSGVLVGLADKTGTQPSMITIMGLADRFNFKTSTGAAYQTGDYFDIATGDLDKAVDDQGNGHDEVVVAYAGPDPNGGNQLTVNIAVLNYGIVKASPGPAPVLATASHSINAQFISDGHSQQTNALLPVDASAVAVAVGDFDGDGQNEIAVLHLADYQTYMVTIFRYANEGRGIFGLSVKEVSSLAGNVGNGSGESYAGTVDLVAGDFNGDGKDDLVCAGSTYNLDYLYASLQFTLALSTIESDANLNLAVRGRTWIDHYDNGNSIINFDDVGYRMRTQLAAGLFKVDLANNFGLDRRQFVVAWNAYNFPSGGSGIGLAGYTLSDDLNQMNTLANNYLVSTVGEESNQRFSIAAGLFKGNKDIQHPEWSLAVNAWTVSVSTAGPAYYLALLDVVSGAFSGSVTQQSAPPPVAARLPLVAYDADGDSVYLGAPLHITLDNVASTDFILQEPPKHTYYDNRPTLNGQPNPDYGMIKNVSRYDNFNVALTNGKTTALSTTFKDTTVWSIGASAEASAGLTVTEGADVGMAGAKESVSADFTARGSYDYDQHQENYNSQYQSRSVTFTGATTEDDYLIGRFQTIDIWRYRVYGTVSSGPQDDQNAFYDLILPGPATKFEGSGLPFDWYQPVQENGNILSYPAYSTVYNTPPFPDPKEVGSYSVSGTLKPGLLIEPQLLTWDGNTDSITVTYSDTDAQGTSLSYSHTLAESADVKISGSASVNALGEGGEIRGSVDFGFHNTNSWGQVATSENTTNESTSITLNKSVSGVNSNQTYTFYPSFYMTRDGTVKVAHAVDNPGSPGLGADFWNGFYGRGPDPALNLPNRFYATSSVYSLNQPVWSANTMLNRKELRGFFLREADRNPVTGDFDYLKRAVAPNDQVRIDVRIYNYSTAVAFSNLKVRFQAVAVDKSDADVGNRITICNPVTSVPGRCDDFTLSGTVGALGMTTPSMTTASIVWDTKAYPPPGINTVPAGASQLYRIYVVLDPDNDIPNEIYETEVAGTTDPGQNNEGYGFITFMQPSEEAASRRGCTITDPRCGNQAPRADAYLRPDSLAGLEMVGLGKNFPELKTGKVRAYVGQQLRLRAAVYTDQSHREFSHLLLYDGDPDGGGRIIAGKLVHSGDAVNGTKVWFEWIPRTLGEHRLYVKLLERVDDKNPGNNVATLVVNVVPADFSAPTLALKLTPNVLHPADGRLVPVTATLTVRDDQDAHPVIKLESITSSEASGPAPDITGAEFGTDDRSFSLRAGQSGKAGPGRLYTVVYSATDASGNKTSATAYVRVLAGGAHAPGCNWGDTHNCGK